MCATVGGSYKITIPLPCLPSVGPAGRPSLPPFPGGYVIRRFARALGQHGGAKVHRLRPSCRRSGRRLYCSSCRWEYSYCRPNRRVNIGKGLRIVGRWLSCWSSLISSFDHRTNRPSVPLPHYIGALPRGGQSRPVNAPYLPVAS